MAQELITEIRTVAEELAALEEAASMALKNEGIIAFKAVQSQLIQFRCTVMRPVPTTTPPVAIRQLQLKESYSSKDVIKSPVTKKWR